MTGGNAVVEGDVGDYIGHTVEPLEHFSELVGQGIEIVLVD